MPLLVDGPRTDPPVSVPRPAIANVAARATPVPPDEPAGERVRLCGFRIWPPRELLVAAEANSDRFAFAMITAPAARSFFTTNASSGGIEPSSITEPPVVGMSAVSMLSFRTIGMPCSGDRGPFDFRSASRARAVSIAFGLTVITDAQHRPLAIEGLNARQKHLNQPLRRQMPFGERRIDVGDRRPASRSMVRWADSGPAAAIRRSPRLRRERKRWASWPRTLDR